MCYETEEYKSIFTLDEKLFFEKQFTVDDFIDEILFQLKKNELEISDSCLVPGTEVFSFTMKDLY